MKSSDEMYQNILNRRNTYLEKKKQRITIIKRTISLCACFAVIFSGYQVWQNVPKTPQNPPVADESSESTSEYISYFNTSSPESTENNPQSSDFVSDNTSDEKTEPDDSDSDTTNSNTQSSTVTTRYPTETFTSANQSKPIETHPSVIKTVPLHTETPLNTTQTKPIETKPSITAPQNPTTITTQSVTEPATTYPKEINIEVPPNSNSYLFDSYSELSEALNKQDSVFSEDSGSYGRLFSKMLSLFENNELDLFVPAINGAECTLRNKEGFSNISLMTSELYYLPWIGYHCNVDGSNIDIKLSYLCTVESIELNSAKTYYEVLKMIAPNAPNPDNYTEFESYQNIYEAGIKLANDKNVVAMISEIKDSSKVYVMFNYDGVLVYIYTDNNNMSEEFWNSFSLTEY